MLTCTSLSSPRSLNSFPRYQSQLRNSKLWSRKKQAPQSWTNIKRLTERSHLQWKQWVCIPNHWSTTNWENSAVAPGRPYYKGMKATQEISWCFHVLRNLKGSLFLSKHNQNTLEAWTDTWTNRVISYKLHLQTKGELNSGKSTGTMAQTKAKKSSWIIGTVPKVQFPLFKKLKLLAFYKAWILEQ